MVISKHRAKYLEMGWGGRCQHGHGKDFRCHDGCRCLRWSGYIRMLCLGDDHGSLWRDGALAHDESFFPCFFHMLGSIIPTDKVIFFRGWTAQPPSRWITMVDISTIYHDIYIWGLPTERPIWCWATLEAFCWMIFGDSPTIHRYRGLSRSAPQLGPGSVTAPGQWWAGHDQKNWRQAGVSFFFVTKR